MLQAFKKAFAIQISVKSLEAVIVTSDQTLRIPLSLCNCSTKFTDIMFLLHFTHKSTIDDGRNAIAGTANDMVNKELTDQQ